jgi:hypothetical protein
MEQHIKYSDKLKSYRWIKKRDRIIERDKGLCRDCFESCGEMNVHHLYYDKEPWDVPDEALILLCDDCHKIEHERFESYLGPPRNLNLRKKGFRAKDYESLCYLNLAISCSVTTEAEAIESIVKHIDARNELFAKIASSFKGPEDGWE